MKNSDEMERYCEQQLHLDKQATVIGTVFNHMSSTADSSPTDLDYTIRYCKMDQPRFQNKMKYRYSLMLEKCKFYFCYKLVSATIKIKQSNEICNQASELPHNRSIFVQIYLNSGTTKPIKKC